VKKNVCSRRRLITFTAFAMVTAPEAGANEYVMKPFTKEVILEKLAILGIDL
jgi:DNA-binding response OmpR family regulator